MFLSQWSKVLNVLAKNLEEAGSPYAPLIRLVEQRSLLVQAALAAAPSLAWAQGIDNPDDDSGVGASGTQAWPLATNAAREDNRIARANGKTLSLAQPASGSLLEVLQRGGFIESASDEDAQFWLHKGSVQ